MKAFKFMKAALSVVPIVWTINFLDLCWGDLASREASEEPQKLQWIKWYKAEAPIEPQINTNVYNFLLVFFLTLLTTLYQGIIDKQLSSCSTVFVK